MSAAGEQVPWRVLVVDDNPLIRDSVVFAVRRLNERIKAGSRTLQLHEAEDGATAWDRCADATIDLLITDLYMPVLTGLRLIERIRETSETAAMKILAISASIEDARITSLSAGADMFLQKPIRLVDLMDAVATLLKLDLKTPPAASARQVALGVLVRVARDGAYADRALDVAMTRSTLSERDRALTTELVYGTLRQQIYIDFLLAGLAAKPLRKTPPSVHAALRLGAYQILETRIPAHAAVNESVALIQDDYRHAAGFVNAVLRKLSTLKEADKLPTVEATIDDPLEALAIQSSHALWIVATVARQRGLEAARAWTAANNERPRLCLRVNRTRTTPDEVQLELEAQGIEVERPDGFADGLRLTHAGHVAALSGLTEGRFTVQDLGAQLIAHLAEPVAGSFVLDACAAPGGKATHLAEMLNGTGTVLATDVHAGKTRLIAAHGARLGLANLKAGVADATDPDALEYILRDHGRTEVDLAVVDAPCTGLGTLRRNPELRCQSEERVGELTRLQDRLLDTVAAVVKPGGILVYAVCTVTEAEGPDRIAAFLNRHKEFRVDAPQSPALAPFVEVVCDAGVDMRVLRTWPDKHGTDGFFGARLVRVSCAAASRHVAF